jgi:hypothetical protein
MSRRPTPLPTTVADCHQLILDLHAKLAQLELHADRLGDELAARSKRSATRTGVSGVDYTDRSLSFHAVFPHESVRHNDP